MPGYGVLGPGEGTGLLPWAWAVERLERSRDYWVATVRPDGRPHVTPVWGVWRGGALWFSASRASRKAKNLAANPGVVVTTSDPADPVILEGRAALVDDLQAIERFAAQSDAKYGTSYGAEFYADPANACFRVEPAVAIGMTHDDFTGSPTRWVLAR